MTKSIHTLRDLAALTRLTPSQKLDMIRVAAVNAIRESIENSNAAPANQLLEVLLALKQRRNLEPLIHYLEKWGNLFFSKNENKLKFTRRRPASDWTEQYRAAVARHDWTEDNAEARNQAVRFVDQEFRTLITKLRKVEHPYLTHRELLAKVEEVLNAYGRSDGFDKEQARGKTLFDESIRRQTMRAGPYAK